MLVDTHYPDMICITESWLSPEVLDTEIAIPGYYTVRRDRNRHGGGVLMYIQQKYMVMQLPVDPHLELITVSTHYRNVNFCFSLFYRPPSSSSSILLMLQNYLESLIISRFTCFLLIGDFNINVLDSSQFALVDYFCNVLGLTQVVNQPTHIYHGLCHSLIDLALVSDMSYFSKCELIPPLSNSDHLGIKLELKTKLRSQVKPLQPQRTIWRYSLGD